MKLNLDQLEAKIQSLVENQLTGMLPGTKLEDRIIQKLAVALKQNIIEQKDKGVMAPNVYAVTVAAKSADMWKDPRFIDTLKYIIYTAGKDVGLTFETTPTITITTDTGYSEGEVSVIASHKLEPVEETQGMATNPNNEPESNNDTIPDNAFLIIEGVKVHPLKESVINIGRRLENHLVDLTQPRPVARDQGTFCVVRSQFHRRHLRQWPADQPDSFISRRCYFAGGCSLDLWAG